MAIIEHEFQIGFRDITKNNKLTNRALIGFFEDVAGMHSNIAGYGLNDIKKTGLTWMLLNWKVKVIRRPMYAETVLVKTWARNANKCFTFRDFEMYDKDNNKIAIAATKWVLIDANTMGLSKVTDSIVSSYSNEDIKVFEDEPEPNKLIAPTDYSYCFEYTIQRKDIDINDHVHNVSYLDIAYEALPEDIYKNSSFPCFEIMYKKEIKLGETIKCFYSQIDNEHYVVMKSIDEKIVHCIVKFTETKE